MFDLDPILVPLLKDLTQNGKKMSTYNPTFRLDSDEFIYDNNKKEFINLRAFPIWGRKLLHQQLYKIPPLGENWETSHRPLRPRKDEITTFSRVPTSIEGSGRPHQKSGRTRPSTPVNSPQKKCHMTSH
ncbi:hypothetical protein TNIN_119271 [Trichonephila inaurata madagascariensis]|uniref:Uncharacterized protein n=1 Tax=Trichonephila inaurata madagascariensis TaxID=2747483 RepID=A0A8X7CIA4_9ARAC|nr:hypothetical protein TNIN_119271 [Trichonephila inaurata madagascariensis]